MPHSLEAFAAVVGGLITLIGGLGCVVVYLRGSQDKATIERLGRSNGAFKELMAARDAQHVGDLEQIAALEEANRVLVKTANSSDQIAAMQLRLTVLIEEQGDRLAEHLTELREELERQHVLNSAPAEDRGHL